MRHFDFLSEADRQRLFFRPPQPFSASDDLNVLGMNFLSSLSGWGVEGRWLILKP